MLQSTVPEMLGYEEGPRGRLRSPLEGGSRGLIDELGGCNKREHESSHGVVCEGEYQKSWMEKGFLFSAVETVTKIIVKYKNLGLFYGKVWNSFHIIVSFYILNRKCMIFSFICI